MRGLSSVDWLFYCSARCARPCQVVERLDCYREPVRRLRRETFDQGSHPHSPAGGNYQPLGASPRFLRTNGL